jgi:hypothetical protein
VRPPHRPRGAKAIRLAGPWRGAAHVYAYDRVGVLEEDGRAAGQALTVGGVSHEHAGHVAEVIEHGILGVRALG